MALKSVSSVSSPFNLCKRKEATGSARQAVAAIREEATAGGGDVMDELNIIVAGLSADIEEIIERRIEAERIDVAQELMVQKGLGF